ncbi:hypothetical protein BABINDRAFT_159637 [Babjeviella inositovora NRRL Y-12698]|uniref:coproporphyrinogen oxidase n=1 Tax=Babjeviella inositovora NRRL Y-12698 TaxID=984486 RepID=A0A1E3R1C2_9ASCO|nr:uncharacterized protein BABINDRAFT_159637 [Babjeviella inositovora NRRL Y-12698]ODQ83197.1 hypothetical protein BABINDRAFT_159637 [Babjeviella inositovora NRRL Y-12698]
MSQLPQPTGAAITESAVPIRERMEALVRRKQKQICDGIEALETSEKTFGADSWQRGNDGGGGTSCILQNGDVFEKAGVNISVVYGALPPQAIARMKVDHKNLKASTEDGSVKFFACGLSLVIHPHNPHAPTTHANYRYFETWNEDGTPQAWWFGGGADLTPSYLYDEDAVLFHTKHKEALDKYDTTLYPRYKKWCDEYFYIKHREETRGVGGIFFDDFDSKPADEILTIIDTCIDAFLPSYVPTLHKRINMLFTEQEKQWQQVRRGRYVEFNLVLDRGTQFGLMTPGSRIESILMSLPMTAGWLYDHHPEEGSREARLVEVLKSPVEWC